MNQNLLLKISFIISILGILLLLFISNLIQPKQISNSENLKLNEFVKVQGKIIQPTIVYDYPVEAAGLAKTQEGNEKFVDSFEIIANGMELGLSYCEQNDPRALEKYWKFAEEKFRHGDLEAQPTDPDFINALKTGMPPTSGLGVGIDRLAILLANQNSIRDVLMFPFMKPEKD